MNARLDRFGRLLVPKRLRQRLGLETGVHLHLEARDGVLVVTPVYPSSLLEVDDGLLVFGGEFHGDPEDIMKEVRVGRLDGLQSHEEPC